MRRISWLVGLVTALSCVAAGCGPGSLTPDAVESPSAPATSRPTAAPTQPTHEPSIVPTSPPSTEPTPSPVDSPTPIPPTIPPATAVPPSPEPTPAPTATPQTTALPTTAPTGEPTPRPTLEPTPAITGWRGEYYGNRDLVGTPLLIRNDPDIDFDWGTSGAGGNLPADSFSARWTRSLFFAQGTFRFHVVVDDGARLFLDGTALIDAWRDGERREFAVDHTLEAGDHTLRVEYYERAGEAVIHVWWERLDSSAQWNGEYYDNRDLTGAPVLVREDEVIDFDWGLGSPGAEVPVDRFSARWTRTATFETAVYRFHVFVDDGARLWVDDALVVDDWREGGPRETAVDLALSAGEHGVRAEYFEEGGSASFRVWWERVEAAGEWEGSYWDNQDLAGDPILTRQDSAVDFNWGKSAPTSGMPADGFGVRWKRQADFDEGVYLFHVLVDDGARLWVDGGLLIDEWYNTGVRETTADVALAAGAHDLRVEYCERTGDALIHLWWERLGSPAFPEWKGEYWPNQGFEGDPALIRNDEKIDFDWGMRSPAYGLPENNFSASWRREITFAKGTYRFHARASDGIRVYIDGNLVLHEWYDSDGTEVHTFELALTGGAHQFLIEYYENTGRALVRFWWEQVGS